MSSPVSLLDGFYQHPRLNPDSNAVQDGTTTLSYARLEILSNQCASALRAHGVKAGDIVGVVLPRSWQLVVCTLAIVKSGAVVAPLDTNSPPSRINEMIQDIGCRLVVGDPDLFNIDQAATLAFDALMEGETDDFEPVKRDRDALAYIFFTSGSTGKPKAVLVPERGVLRLGKDGYIPFAAGMRFASMSNPSFDAINFDIWAPILTGGTCVIIPPETIGDFGALRQVFDAQNIDTAFLTVALFNAIVAEVPDCFANARTILIGGEQINTPTVLKWYADNGASNCTIYNVYGPTECATFSLSYPIPRNETARNAPIGHPLPDTEIHVDADAVTGVGELMIAGDAVALGYHNRPDTTAAAFVMREGKFWYKTGDLVTRGPDGAITYVSRIGRQIKVRGFRIEPGEVEATLNTFTGLSRCFVGARANDAGVTEISAYLVFAAETSHDVFRAFMRENLPSYMVPHHLYVMDDFPMSRTGKIDTTALFARDVPRWHPVRADIDTDPRNAALLALAQAVLENPNLTLQDRFIDGGGDSLATLRLRHRIVREMALDVQSADILTKPLVELLANARPVDTPAAPVAESQAASAPATSEQKRLWLHAQRFPESRSYNVPLIFRLEGAVDAERLRTAFDEVFQHHPTFRTAFQDIDGTLRQIIRPQNACSIVCHPVGAFTKDTWEGFAITAFSSVFDLANDPLYRAHFLPLSANTGVLLIHAHHIILDGWSLNLMLDEVSDRYNATAPVTRDATATMADFYDVQNRLFASDTYQQHRQILSDLWQAQPDPDAPLHPRRTSRDLRAQVHRVPLGRNAQNRVQMTAQKLDVTPFQIYLAACGWAFGHVSGQQAFAIASPVNNRDNVRFASSIGMVANTALFPVATSSQSTLNETLVAQSRTWATVLAHQDVAFEHLLDDLAGTRHATAAAQFECMFVMENTDYDALTFDGVSVQFDLPRQVDAKAPLTVFVLPRDTGPELIIESQNSYFSAADTDRFASAFAHAIASLEELNTPLATVLQPTGRDLKGPDTETTDPTVAQRIMDQAVRTPDALAARQGDTTFSYKDLMGYAGALATTLRMQIPTTAKTPVVGLYMNPSLEHITAITALAHLNITILPLDPSYPEKLLTHIVETAQPDLILTCGSAPDRNFGTVSSLRVELEHGADLGPPPVQADNPLYTLFTSGSTGTPKSVSVWNDTICNLLDWQKTTGGIKAPCQTQQFSKLSFDVSFQETLTTLTTGGTLHLLLPHQREDPDALLDAMHVHKIERIFLPFIGLKILAETAVSGGIALPDLKQVISAGEQLLCTRDIRAWFEMMPDARLINHYGPSETHVICAHTLPADVSDWPDIAPIGQPIANVTLRREGPDGSLWVSGKTLRPAYGTAAQNAAQYSRDNAGLLWYRTGDTVVLHRNDQLIYQGREDTQIKVSGHRLELGHVEAVLNARADIRLSILRLTAPDILIAFVEFTGDPVPLNRLNTALSAHLPPFVRLSQVVAITHWPKTPSGKIDQKSLCAPNVPTLPAEHTQWPNTTQERLAGLFTDTLGRGIMPTQSYFDAGATSLELMKFRNACQTAFDTKISVADLFAHATIDKLAMLVEPAEAAGSMPVHHAHAQTDKLAIVGMAVDLPGAPSLDAFGAMIRSGTSGITYFEGQDGKVGARSELADMLGFDPAYFGISPQEAAVMDPQQRHLLMGAVHVLQDAGITPANSTDRIGVIASSGENTYFQDMLRKGDPQNRPDTFQMALHQDKDYLATKLAYRLGLTGPALTVQAACGSSLIGVHMAAGMLRNGDCDAMLVGGCLIDVTLSDGYTYRPQHIFSRDGTCRPFDKDATGTIGASGWGFVMLKPLDRARADGNNIYCVLEGSAINNDGNDKMSYTAPSVIGQRDVLAAALRNSGLAAGDIDYVEAHGTGTQLGDPIEIAAVNTVYGARRTPLMISSVKSQIGHAGAAAGVIGLIRASLAIKMQVIPPNLHYRAPNPELGIEDIQIDVPPTPHPWITSHLRRAGISSFGIGGTNAHAIIGEVAQARSTPMPAPMPVFLLSAKSADSLTVWACTIADFLTDHSDQTAEMLRFLQSNTSDHDHRFGFVWRSTAHAIKTLRQIIPTQVSITQQEVITAKDTAEQTLTAWLEGARIDWGRTVAPAPDGFPLYPFARKTYRFLDATQLQTDTPDRLQPDAWLHQPVWVRHRCAPSAPQRDRAIILCSERNTTAQTTAIGEGYADVTMLCLADAFEDHGDSVYSMPLDKAAFATFAGQFRAMASVDVINLLPADLPAIPDTQGMAQAQLACLDVMPCLVALATALTTPDLRLINISVGASGQSGQVYRPLAGLLAGATHAIACEHDLKCYWLDLDDNSRPYDALASFDPSAPPGRYAFAAGQLWRSATVPVAPIDAQKTTGKHTIVIGGTGGIGRNICQHLLSQDDTTTIDIISRAPVLPHMLQPYAHRIRLHACDLTDPDTAWPVFAGPVDRIVFAAGIGSYATLGNRDALRMGQSNRIKTAAMLTLEQLIERTQTAEVIYCSSMASHMGGVGQVDYAATNGLLDAFAQWQNPRAPHTQRTVINWDIWAQSGMAANALANDGQHQRHLSVGLTDAEGRAVFAQALALRSLQILVSTVPLEQAKQFYSPAATSPPIPVISATDDAPLAEQLIRLIFAETGVENLTMDLTLEDIGVDSLMAIDLMEEIETTFDIALTMDQFHGAQTLGGLMTCLAPAQTDMKDMPVSKSISIQKWQSGTSNRAVCLIHPVGGETAAYKTLARYIGTDITIFTISDPNLATEPPTPLDIRPRATLYLAALDAKIDLAKTDCALVGWSFGAWVAQEMAVQSLNQTHPVRRLTMIDPPEPDVGARLQTYTETEIQAAFLHDLMPQLPPDTTSDRPLDTKIAPELQNHLDKIVRCCALNMDAMRNHQPRPLARIETRIFIADETAAGLLVAPIDTQAHLAKWRPLLGNVTQADTLNADHYSIMDMPVIQTIAAGLFD